jgi:hypothetical protein
MLNVEPVGRTAGSNHMLGAAGAQARKRMEASSVCRTVAGEGTLQTRPGEDATIAIGAYRSSREATIRARYNPPVRTITVS